MNLDVVIGNPPYQISDNDSGKGSAMPVYHHFIKSAIDIKPAIVSLITPSIWFTGGKGLNSFRESMLADNRFKLFHNFETPKDVFPGVSLRGGVNYFIWDSTYNNDIDGLHVRNQKGSAISEGVRPYTIKGVDFFVTKNEGISVIRKISNVEDINFEIGDTTNLSGYVSPRNPFGFATNFKNDSRFKTSSHDLDEPIKIYASRGDIGYVEKDTILKNQNWIAGKKLITPFANNIGTDLNDDNLNVIIADDNTIVTETYLLVGIGLASEPDELSSLKKYLETKFVRFLISLAKANQNGTRKTYQLVPLQDFTEDSDIDWNQSVANIDQQLYKKYNLNEEEIEFIETNVKEMTQT